VTLYLDASLLIALLTNDALTARADALLRSHTPVLAVSDFAAAEFASAMARRVRTQEITAAEARLAFSHFDAWTARATQRVDTMATDVKAAEAFLRRLDLTLRTPDALNIAIAQRLGAALATFDEKTARSARALGTEILPA
jgi:uncharacterized protein